MQDKNEMLLDTTPESSGCTGCTGCRGRRPRPRMAR